MAQGSMRKKNSVVQKKTKTQKKSLGPKKGGRLKYFPVKIIGGKFKWRSKIVTLCALESKCTITDKVEHTLQ